MKLLASTHYLVGGMALACFLLSGGYMMMSFPDLYQGNEAMRHLYRTNHIYILFSSLINFWAGLVLTDELSRSSKIRWSGSILVLVAPVLLIIAFFNEVEPVSPDRPFSYFGVVSLGVGTLFYLVDALKENRQKGRSKSG